MARRKRKETADAGEGINWRKSVYFNKGHAYFRRANGHAGMRERVDERVRCGAWKHVRNEDDVEVYRVVPRGKRKPERDLSAVHDVTLENAIVHAACKRDWSTYVAALGELRARHNGSDLPQGTSSMMFAGLVNHLQERIERRADGPSKGEIQKAMAGLKQKQRGRRIYVPH